MKGPNIDIRLSCSDCQFCRTERYDHQGDRGSDVYCEKEGKSIGDTTWKTPKWCPYWPTEKVEIKRD